MVVEVVNYRSSLSYALRLHSRLPPLPLPLELLCWASSSSNFHRHWSWHWGYDSPYLPSLAHSVLVQAEEAMQGVEEVEGTLYQDMFDSMNEVRGL